jgi:hypothetical protein
MSFSSIVIPLLSFAATFAVRFYCGSPAEMARPDRAEAHPVRIAPASSALPGPLLTDPASQLRAMLARPASERDDEALRKLSQLLLADDPEAAFRAAMALDDGRSEMRAAAAALVKEDPAAARRLVSECPDLRSRRILEAELIADEVSRDPLGKLRWAEETLEGDVRRKVLNDGVIALAKQDPAAALDFVATLPPGIVKTNAAIRSLSYRMAQDPARALSWLDENTSASERRLISSLAFKVFARDSPEAAMALLPTLLAELRGHLASATLDGKIREIKDPAEYFAAAVDHMDKLPVENRLFAVRSLTSDVFMNGHREGRTIPALLASVTEPASRAAVIEHLMTFWFSPEGIGVHFDDEAEQAALDERNLSLLQSPEDKQAAARVVPFFTDLTEARRQALLDRLK